LLTTNAIGEPINGSVLSPFSISESGAVVAFETTADDLVSKDLNRAPDIFVSHVGLLSGRHPDLPEGTGFGVGTLHRGSVNANGRRIAFLSTDSWLILNDTNQMPDLFLYDLGADSAVNIDRLVLSNSPMASLMSANGASIVYEGVNLFLQPASSRGALFRVDLRSGQSQQLGTASSFSGSGLWQPSLSQDGRWLVVQDSGHIRMTDFRTPALPGQANNQIVDVRFDGTQQGNGPSSSPMISVDGDWVVFLGRATDLITLGADGGTGTVYPPSVPQAFARNLRQQRTRLLSITDTGAPLPTGATNPVLSANARYVAFETYSGSKIYRHDLLATGRVTNLLVCSDCSRPSISGDGQLVAYLSQGQVYISLAGGAPQSFPGVSEVTEVTLSIDGRFIAWVSRASGVAQVYLEDRWNGNRHLVSHKYLGTDDGNGPSTRPVFSHDGRTLAFQSFASDLVPGDYNGRRDIFVVEISPVDTDSDGMDDDWETHYFQSLVRDGSGNVDGDHLTDREEFLAGSDPLDSASDLRFTRISSRIVSGPMQDTEVKWTSAPGKTYRVQHAPDLAAPWADLSDDIITGGPTGSATHLDLLHRTGFYRLLLVE
jgi:Tol biopolymer transport system component